MLRADPTVCAHPTAGLDRFGCGAHGTYASLCRVNILSRGVLVGVFAVVTAGCASKGGGGGEAYPLVLAGSRDRGDPAVVMVHTGGGICTGTVISSRHVLTAAHCVRDPSRLSVAASRHSIEVTRVHLPPRAHNSLRNDIAVVEVADAMTTTPVPVNLDPDALAEEMRVRLVGYGLTGTTNRDSGVKREGEAEVRRTDSYLRTVPGTGGSCYGDSGGPALARIHGRETVVGVVSHGLSKRCENGSELVRTDVHRAFLASFVGASGASRGGNGGGGGSGGSGGRGGDGVGIGGRGGDGVGTPGRPGNPINPPPPPTPPSPPEPPRIDRPSLPGIAEGEDRPRRRPSRRDEGDGRVAVGTDENGCQVVTAPGLSVRICSN